MPIKLCTLISEIKEVDVKIVSIANILHPGCDYDILDVPGLLEQETIARDQHGSDYASIILLERFKDLKFWRANKLNANYIEEPQ